MTLLLIVVRVVVVLMIVRFLLRFVASIWEGAKPVPKRRSAAERTGGTLVRDPNCGTYLPESRAITVGRGAGAQHFCSPACRDAYTEAHRGNTSGSALTS